MALVSPEQFAQTYLANRMSRDIGMLSPEAAAASVLGQEKIGRGYSAIANAGIPTALKGRAGMIGAGAAGLGVAANQLLGGEPLGAVAGLGGSVVGGRIGSSMGRVFGTPGRLIGGALGSVAGGLIAGQGAEYAKAAVTGAGKGTAPGSTEPPAYIPGTNIPLNETARYLESQKAIGNLQLDFSNRMNAAERAGMKDIMQHSVETQIQLIKRQAPYIQQAKDQDMVRTQALMNTGGNIDARLGMLATQGALAKGAQAEAGALARTFAGTNPYAQFANRQSPNIQFG
jgi:hypothetical protein